MNKIKEIEEAITKLPKHDLSDLIRWLDDYLSDNWDKEFEEDVKAGMLDRVAEDAIADYREGKCKEL